MNYTFDDLNFDGIFDFSSSSSSDYAPDESIVDSGSAIFESNTFNALNLVTQNRSELHGIQINPTEYPKTTTDVYQINRNYSDRSTDIMRYESYRLMKNPSRDTKKCNLSQSELVIKILGLVIGMPANSDFGLPFENDFLFCISWPSVVLIQYRLNRKPN